MEQIPPVMLSSVICERVIIDRITNSPTLINIIQGLAFPKFPFQHNSLFFFAELTNGHGTIDAQLTLVDTENNEKIMFRQDGKLTFKEPKHVVTFIANLQGVVFPQPGEYRFQLFAANQLLAERKMICRQAKQPPTPPNFPPPQSPPTP